MTSTQLVTGPNELTVEPVAAALESEDLLVALEALAPWGC